MATVSPTDIWAVGSRSGRTTLLEHWNGDRWTVARPALKGLLQGVSASSANNVWAVGGTRAFPAKPLVLHFDGRRWTEVPLPLPGRRSALYDVVALGPNDVWAVGEATLPPPTPDQRGLAAHWNGRTWSVDLLGTEPLLGVDGIRGGAVWTVGAVQMLDQPPYVLPTVERWTGAKWVAVDPGFTDDLNGVDVQASGDVWAVGGKYGTAQYQVAAHFDGRRWTRLRPGAHDWLNDVVAISANNVRAAGYRDLVHWNGRAWKRTKVAAEMTGIAALSGRNVWAVGTGGRGAAVRHYACR